MTVRRPSKKIQSRHRLNTLRSLERSLERVENFAGRTLAFNDVADAAERIHSGRGLAKQRRVRRGHVWCYCHELVAYVFCRLAGRTAKGYRVLDLSGHATPTCWITGPGNIHWISYDEPRRPYTKKDVDRAWKRWQIQKRRLK